MNFPQKRFIVWSILVASSVGAFSVPTPVGHSLRPLHASHQFDSIRSKPMLDPGHCRGASLSMKSSGGEKRQGFWRRVLRRGSPRPTTPRSTMPRASTPSRELTNRPMSETEAEASRGNWGTFLVRRFFHLLFKGMTLPFPMLRELAADDDDGKAVIGFSLAECTWAIVSYLGLGTLAYAVLFERWSITDALYFSVSTFTSVGYGDLYPTTLVAKIFTCFFGLAGLAFLGAAISTIGSSLLKAEQKVIEAAEEASRKRVMAIFEGMPTVVKHVKEEGPNTTLASMQEAPDSEEEVQNVVPAWKTTVRKTVGRLVPAFAFLFAGGIFMGMLEGWELTDGLYYSIITAGTIGYGDFSPHTSWGRMWGIMFIPMAVAAAGDVLGNVASSLVERRQENVYHALLKRELTLDSLLNMDTDSNGEVSREEYVQSMLIEMDLVNEEVFQDLHAQFDRLDVDKNGQLDREDLRIMAQQRGIKVD